MSKFSYLVLLTSLLILTSCSTPQMMKISSKHYSSDHEKMLLELKSQYLTGKKNSQIAFTPLQSENGYVNTYFFWEDNKQLAITQDDNRIFVPQNINIDNVDITSTTDTVEKVIINNVESIYPHDSGWLSTLIAKSEALPAGEHRIQFDGRKMFNPEGLMFLNYLGSYLENISFFADFKISFHYDPADDIYNTTIWLIKKS